MTKLTRYDQAKKITLFGALINLFLAIIKLIFGTIGLSHALIADGVHSLADLVTDALVIVASKFGSKHADEDHPYGHQRIETASTVALAILLMLAGAGIMWSAIDHLISKSMEMPKFYVLIIAFISVAANEVLFRFTLKVARKINSQLLIANAWHHRSDAWASIVVLIGIAGALLGYHYFDAIAAIIVGVMIIKMGWDLSWSSLRELVDTAVSPEVYEKIKEIITKTPGVIEVHQLRTRLMGANVLVDVHVLVAANLSVSEGHYIATRVHHALIKKLDIVKDVTVHIDPEDDEVAAPNKSLPSRKKVLNLLQEQFRNCFAADEIEKITLHYLSGKINIEIWFPVSILSQIKDVERLKNEYQQAVKDISYIDSVVLLFSTT